MFNEHTYTYSCCTCYVHRESSVVLSPKGDAIMAKAANNQPANNQAENNQIENALRNVRYPVTRETLIAQLEQQQINEQTRNALRQLPNQHYRSANEIMRALDSAQQQGNIQTSGRR
jgi:hypothetical protein